MFGHVLQGQDIVREVENQRVDSKSKPISDVRIANCGELIPKSRLKKGNYMKFFRDRCKYTRKKLRVVTGCCKQNATLLLGQHCFWLSAILNHMVELKFARKQV